MIDAGGRGMEPPSTHSTSDNERLLIAMLKHVHLLAVMLDKDAKLIYCNQYFLDLTGWRREEILSRNWFQVFKPPEEYGVRRLFSDLLNDSPTAWHYENPIRTKSGKLRYIRWNNTLIRHVDGSATGIASLGEDITESRVLERSLLDAITREQRKLGLEMHDGLGQDLFGIALLATSLATETERQRLSVARELRQLSGAVSDAIETCRTIAHGLSPLSGVSGGLVDALREMTRMPRLWEGAAVKFELIAAAPLTLPLNTQDHIYRIAQEALANALKHSQARSITLRFMIDTAKTRLEVVDDGIGIPPVSESTGMGLRTMQYRANLIHGNFIRSSKRPGGTTIAFECAQSAPQRFD
jgi:PAS domain S-box-containing protein